MTNSGENDRAAQLNKSWVRTLRKQMSTPLDCILFYADEAKLQAFL